MELVEPHIHIFSVMRTEYAIGASMITQSIPTTLFFCVKIARVFPQIVFCVIGWP